MSANQIRHSVVVVSYNQRHYIERALSSLVNQELLPYEVIVLDDASRDGTADLARKFFQQNSPSFRYAVVENESNLGIACNMLKASEVASGSVVSLLAADDYWLPNAVRQVEEAIQAEKLDPEKDVFVCFAPTYSVDAVGRNGSVSPNKVIRKSPLKTMLRKCATFGKIGFSRSAMLGADYPSDLGIWADWAWDVSIAARANVYYELSDLTHVHFREVGVSAKTPPSEIDASYLATAEYILGKYRGQLSLLDRVYLLGEVFYYRGRVHNSFASATLGGLLVLFNVFNCGGLSPAKSLVSRYLPERMIALVRKTKTP